MSDTPYGLCHCGCGQKTAVSRWSNAAYGYVKGEPRKYRRGHHDPYANKKIREVIDNGDGTASITLTKGYAAIIDVEDIPLVSDFNWYAIESRNTAYASRAGDTTGILMHRGITKCPDGMQVDHVDGDGLNNTRGNLRICTHAENMLNKRTYRNSPTGFRGVYPVPNGKFIARIRVDERWLNLGTYDTPEEAAAVRDKATIEHYGEFGRINIIEKRAS